MSEPPRLTLEELRPEGAHRARPAARGRLRISLRTRRALEGYAFLSPWIVGVLVFMAYPLLESFYLSFHELQAINIHDLRFVGLGNYEQAFVVDAKFIPNLLGTFQNNVVDVPTIVLFSLGVALLANQRLLGITLFRGIFFLPVVIGSALVIRQLFNQGIGGFTLNSGGVDVRGFLLTYFGPDVGQQIADTVNRVQLVLWRSGIQTLIFIAGLRSISSTLYEAGRVDGATDWELVWKVTLPLLSPFVLLNVIYTIVDSFTDTFNQMMQYIHDVAFSGQFRLGYAAALGWIYFALIFLILGAVLWIARGRVFYAGER